MFKYFFSLDFVVLYEKTFLLNRNVSFPNYMKSLDEMRFPSFYVVIDEVLSRGYYTLNTFFYVPYPSALFDFPIARPFSRWIILHKAIISYSKSKSEVKLEAGMNSVFFVFGVVLCTLIIFCMLYVINIEISSYTITFLILIILYFSVLRSIYNRDAKRYQAMIDVAQNLGIQPRKKKPK